MTSGDTTDPVAPGTGTSPAVAKARGREVLDEYEAVAGSLSSRSEDARLTPSFWLDRVASALGILLEAIDGEPGK